MSTPAHTFLQTHVVPGINDFGASPLDIRKAMNSAVALNQLADYFWRSYSKTDSARVFHAENVGAFRDELGKRHPEFAIVRDVAEAHKHMTLNRTSRVVTGSAQTAVGSTGYGVSGYNTGPWGGGPSIVVDLDNGSQIHFSSVAKTVFDLWQVMLR